MSKGKAVKKNLPGRKPAQTDRYIAIIKLKFWLGLIIAGLAFFLYIRSVTYQYTLDDSSVVKNNTLTSQGLKGIPQLLKTDYWYGFSSQVRGPVYRPAPMIMFAIEWQLFPDSIVVPHLVNVLFYTVTCWLIFLVLCKLFKDENLLLPFLSTLLYTAHPIHSEVVNSIKSLDEIFCFCFGIIAVYLALRWTDKKSWRPLLLSALSYFISLLSKETAISFLVIIPVTLFVFTKVDKKNLIQFSGAYFIITLIFLFIRHLVVSGIESTNSALNNTLFSAPDFVSQKATTFYILLRYIFLLIIPYPQSYDYSFAEIPIKQFFDPLAFLGMLIYLLFGIYAVIKIRKKDSLAFSILFYLLTLAPVANIFILIGSTMAERFLYIPSLGFCIALVIILTRYGKHHLKGINLKNETISVRQLVHAHRRILIVVLIITLIYSGRTIARSAIWKDNVTLFGTDVKTVANSARAHCNWGAALLLNLYKNEQDPEKKSMFLDQALDELSIGISIFPGQVDAEKNLAYCYAMKKDYINQIKTLEAINQNYKSPDTTVYKNLAIAYSLTNNYDKALSMTDSAMKYLKSGQSLCVLKALCFSKKGMNIEAINEYEKYLKLYPNDPAGYANMGLAYLNMGENSKAVNLFNQSLRLNPKFAPAYCYLGKNYYQLKQYQEAINYYNKSMEVDSTNIECMALASQAYIAMGDSAKAFSLFERAKRIRSSF